MILHGRRRRRRRRHQLLALDERGVRIRLVDERFNKDILLIQHNDSFAADKTTHRQDREMQAVEHLLARRLRTSCVEIEIDISSSRVGLAYLLNSR